mmetsp:Transcript_64649/g.107411  ORF Transcript_64649/g.107411 Transcript_64649/m.107411 type:complete len:102 (-) Transcript_64649:144-449(-)
MANQLHHHTRKIEVPTLRQAFRHKIADCSSCSDCLKPPHLDGFIQQLSRQASPPHVLQQITHPTTREDAEGDSFNMLKDSVAGRGVHAEVETSRQGEEENK